jgi:hypothetical protein
LSRISPPHTQREEGGGSTMKRMQVLLSDMRNNPELIHQR